MSVKIAGLVGPNILALAAYLNWVSENAGISQRMLPSPISSSVLPFQLFFSIGQQLYPSTDRTWILAHLSKFLNQKSQRLTNTLNLICSENLQ